MPRYAETRAAHPCCSPMTAGIITSTASIASRAMPACSIARLLASSVKPIALTPCSLLKREVPTPTIAYLSLTVIRDLPASLSALPVGLALLLKGLDALHRILGGEHLAGEDHLLVQRLLVGQR